MEPTTNDQPVTTPATFEPWHVVIARRSVAPFSNLNCWELTAGVGAVLARNMTILNWSGS